MNKPPFQVGQQVLRKLRSVYNPETKKYETRYGAAFTITIVELKGYQWVVGDCYANIYPATHCVDAASYNSPLWKALQEDE